MQNLYYIATDSKASVIQIIHTIVLHYSYIKHSVNNGFRDEGTEPGLGSFWFANI